MTWLLTPSYARDRVVNSKISELMDGLTSQSDTTIGKIRDAAIGFAIGAGTTTLLKELNTLGKRFESNLPIRGSFSTTTRPAYLDDWFMKLDDWP